MKHLNDASADYVNHHDGKIRPISTVDTEIIKEIIQILDLRGGNKDLVSIMKRWKKDQDGHILDEIIQYGLTIDDETGETSGEKGSSKKTKQFIQIDDVILDVRGIIVVLSRHSWDHYNNMTIYTIEINPEHMVSQSTMYKNATIQYVSRDARDIAIRKMEKELENNANVEFYKS